MARNIFFSMLCILLLGAGCTGPQQPKGGNMEMQSSDRPELKKLFALAPESVAKALQAGDLAAARKYVKAQDDLPKELAQGILQHEVWTGMTAEEIAMSIGKLEKSTDVPGEYRYPLEGLVLRFNAQGYLATLAEQ